jgi:hypothetical protein
MIDRVIARIHRGGQKTQGLKPTPLCPSAARLKSGPDTELNLSVVRLKSGSDTELNFSGA